MSSETIHPSHESVLARPTTLVLPWHRAALGAILLLTGILNFIGLDRVGYGNTYYAAAVKSMLTSWHNFFFVSLDPGGFVTIDKPPLAFWFQAASAKLFGFNGVSLLLPEALAGVASVVLLYYLVSRVFGRPAGLLAALALAVMPVAAVVNRSNLVESILVLTVLLAVWAVMRAVETGKLRWLLLGMALVGVGFNVKMLEAYLVLPALLLVYLVGARARWYTRLWHLVLAGVVLLVVSFSWITAVDLTPASQRPYVGSSGNNSELSLALGYNGLGRLTGNTFSFLQNGTSLSKTVSNLSPADLGFTQGEAGGTGVQRLVNAQLGGQTGWLLALAIIGFMVAAWQTRIRWTLTLQQNQLVVWGAWLLTGGAFFSVAGFFHPYYLAMIGPPIAALAGIGVAVLWQDYRRPGWRGWALPVALLATAALQAHILGYFSSWNGWLQPVVVGVTILVALALFVARIRPLVSGRAVFAAAALGVVALLLAPFVWTEYTVANASGNMVPSAGPTGRGGFGGGGFGRPGRFAGGRYGGFGDRGGFGGSPSGGRGFAGPPGGQGFAPPGTAGGLVGLGSEGGRSAGPGFAPPGGQFGGDDGTSADSGLVRYLQGHQGKSKFLVGTLNSMTADPIIMATGKPVMDLGGFMGADRILTVQQLATRVSDGSIRYFLLSPAEGNRLRNIPAAIRKYLGRHGGFRGRFGGAFPGGRGGGNANSDLVQWVSKSCTTVPSTAYESSTTSTPGRPAFGGFGFGGGAQQLYDCGSYAASHTGA